METEVAEPKKMATLEEAPKRPTQMKAFDTFEELPEEVQQCAADLDHATGQWQAWGAEQQAHRKELSKLMHQHGLKHVPVPNDDDKVFTLKVDDPKEKLVKVPRTKISDEEE